MSASSILDAFRLDGRVAIVTGAGAAARIEARDVPIVSVDAPEELPLALEEALV